MAALAGWNKADTQGVVVALETTVQREPADRIVLVVTGPMVVAAEAAAAKGRAWDLVAAPEVRLLPGRRLGTAVVQAEARLQQELVERVARPAMRLMVAAVVVARKRQQAVRVERVAALPVDSAVQTESMLRQIQVLAAAVRGTRPRVAAMVVQVMP